MKHRITRADERRLASLPEQLRGKIALIPQPWMQRTLLDLPASQIKDWHVTPIDYNFRPASYWDPEDLRQIIANIKGAERKKRARQLLETNALEDASELVLSDGLSEEDRAIFGFIHPALMGGEYLPDYLSGEVEIARVTMQSTTQDVISIRAFPLMEKRRSIGYRILDEYGSDYELKFESSTRPLSVTELIRLLDTADSDQGGVTLDIIELNHECNDQDRDYYADFLEVTSEFYTDLQKHYWFAVQYWVQTGRSKRVKK